MLEPQVGLVGSVSDKVDRQTDIVAKSLAVYWRSRVRQGSGELFGEWGARWPGKRSALIVDSNFQGLRCLQASQRLEAKTSSSERTHASFFCCTDHVVGTALALPPPGSSSECSECSSAASAGMWHPLGSWAAKDV